ncbi:NAD-dependent epimerase/dehydratase family protein [Methanoregula sp.]|uniref:NAD-dependent epimerase/dehydratase family protein n=1 Tax=Methanoregula sp. TaxID=2052170 RepID=UPI00356A1131
MADREEPYHTLCDAIFNSLKAADESILQGPDKKIFITGEAGFFGSRVVKELLQKGVGKENVAIPQSHEIDLRVWENCAGVVKDSDIVIHLAARVGGIGYNQACPAQLFYENAIMGIQLIEASRQEDVGKCVIVGTICAYPWFTPVPFKENNLWNGYPEEIYAPYGLVKKMLLVQVPGIPAAVRF